MTRRILITMRKTIALFMALLVLAGMSACSTPGAPVTSATEKATAQSTAEQATTAPEQTAAPDPYGKYDPPITITSVRTTDTTITPDSGYGDDNTLENNVWTRLAEEQLGIKLVYKWIVAPDQMDQRMNVSIASNDLPDIIPVKVKQLGMLLDADKVVDLAGWVNDYGTPLLKSIFDVNKTLTLNAGAIGDKVYAIPAAANAANVMGTQELFIRKDWLTKLNLPEPKSMQDVLAISSAFTHNDPDGNGQADTFGLAINKQISGTGGFCDVKGFFEGYHAYPYSWVKDASGQLIYGGIQPQVKDALLALQGMYKDGQIDKEFGVKDSATVAESVIAGKCGMQYGLPWNPMYPLCLSNQNDPNADWTAYPIMSIDNSPAKPLLQVGGGDYFTVNKDCEHPEAFIKILNQYADKGFGPDSDRSNYYTDPNGAMYMKLQICNFQFTRFDEERVWYESVHDAFASNDQTKLVDDKSKMLYDKIVAYKNGDSKGNWEYFKFYDYDIGSIGICLKNYLDGGNLIYNEFYGAPTVTMSEKGDVLAKMQDEVFTNIITGSPISDYDKFVNDWKTLGGDQITKEVNDWYASKK
jgi:putative aldouronate transport system substrate-binding protein